MGILNVTPDSFSDGGSFIDPGVAAQRGLEMMVEGADLVDVGGESTRPGAEPVSEDEELRRVVPVVERLAAQGVPISIDTRKGSVAQAALEAGACVVNDVTALSDPRTAQAVAAADATVCLMHMKGDPQTMQVSPQYEDVVSEVGRFLADRARYAQSSGIRRQRIWIDPGIGFGKTLAHNLELLRRLREIAALGYPVLIGVSRKSFIGRVLGGDHEPLPTSERLEGTLAAQTLAQAAGAKIIRAHDVRASRRALEIAQAILAP
jgi:dihydropteroate synthase